MVKEKRNQKTFLLSLPTEYCTFLLIFFFHLLSLCICLNVWEHNVTVNVRLLFFIKNNTIKLIN